MSSELGDGDVPLCTQTGDIPGGRCAVGGTLGVGGLGGVHAVQLCVPRIPPRLTQLLSPQQCGVISEHTKKMCTR